MKNDLRGSKAKSGLLRSSSISSGKATDERDSRGAFFVESGARNALILLVVILFTFIVLIYPVHNLFREQQHLGQLKEELARTQREKEYYSGEVLRWQDDKFIMSYAREHYALIMPGEQAMHVADPDAAGTDKDLNNFDDQRREEIDKEIREANEKYKTPWYEKLESGFRL